MGYNKLSLLHAIVLGIVQGLSEFLPISSSGHLVLVPWLFGWNDFSDVAVKKAFDVALHMGTLVAVVGYFWRDLSLYVGDGTRYVLRRKQDPTVHGRMAWMFLLATIPAAVAGALLDTWIDDTLGKPWLIGVSLIVFGLLLAWADTLDGKRHEDTFTRGDAWRVGVAQALALNPGTSRSGITMTAARIAGFSRTAAARISFVMSVPVISGAVVFKLAKLTQDGLPDGFITAMIVGVIAAAVSGWLAIATLMKVVSTRSLKPFVLYRIAAGIAVLLITASTWR